MGSASGTAATRVRARPRQRLWEPLVKPLSAVRTAPAAFDYKVRAKTGPRAKNPWPQAIAACERGVGGRLRGAMLHQSAATAGLLCSAKGAVNDLASGALVKPEG